MVLFNFLNFFSLFFRIFYSKSGKNGRNDNFFSHFHDPCLLVLALNEAQMVLFNFWILWPFFLKCSILDRVVREWEFFFRSFSTYPDPFSLEMKPEWCFLIFWIFLPFFLEFSTLGGAGRIETINFFSLFLDLSRPVLAWNEAWIAHFYFLYLFAFFLEFSILGRVGQIGTIIFFFSHSQPVPTCFGLKWSLNGCF